MSADARARFDRLILPHLDDGFRLARWLTGNPTDAEDVVQEACLRAFLAMDRLVEHDGKIEETGPGGDVGEILSANSGCMAQSCKLRHARFGSGRSSQPMHDA